MSRVSRVEVPLGTPPVDVEPVEPVVEVEPMPAKGKGKPSTDPEEPTA